MSPRALKALACNLAIAEECVMPEIIPTALNPVHDQDRDACIEACNACALRCQGTAMQMCLPMGGKHAEPKHLGLMLGCATLCRATAEYMLSSALLQNKLAGVCAEICEACAHSCAEIGGMED